jgi:hypothetical protein
VVPSVRWPRPCQRPNSSAAALSMSSHGSTSPGNVSREQDQKVVPGLDLVSVGVVVCTWCDKGDWGYLVTLLDKKESRNRANIYHFSFQHPTKLSSESLSSIGFERLEALLGPKICHIARRDVDPAHGVKEGMSSSSQISWQPWTNTQVIFLSLPRIHSL